MNAVRQPGVAPRALRVLIVEDRADDLLLLLHELERGAYAATYRHVQTPTELRAALACDWDIVLSDFSLPSMTAHDVVSIVKRVRPDVPCIVISGTITEEAAVDVLRAGAADFIVKGRMARLVPAIERELRESEERRRRIESEGQLREARERMQDALETVGIGTWESDIVSGRTIWSEVQERLHGLAPGTFGGTFSAAIDTIVPEDRQRVLDAFDRAHRERSDGTIDYRVRWADGSIHWLSAIGRMLCDAAGQPVRAVGVGFDITHRKALEEHVRQAQKMESIGNLAGGIAHDFNNLLTVIAGECELMMVATPPDSDAAASLEAIRTAAKSASALTRQLLTFSRRQIVLTQLIDLNQAIRKFSKILRRLVEENVAIEFQLAPRLDAVRVDPGQIEQVVLNLVANARDAMPDGGRVTISTSQISGAGPIAVPAGELAAGAYVQLSVADTGVGMSADVQAHLFEPFFTTKGIGRGTGLGLATVHGIVKQSGGDIFVRTAPGAGTTFTIYLPVAAPTPDNAVAPAPPAVRSVDGNETILIVEDNAPLRRLGERILRAHGYTVLTAATAAQARQVCLSHAGTIAVVLADVVMPDESGPAVAEFILRARPQTKVIHMSGYTAADDRVTRHAFLQKPFSAAQLLATVRGVLGAT